MFSLTKGIKNHPSNPKETVPPPAPLAIFAYSIVAAPDVPRQSGQFASYPVDDRRLEPHAD